MCVVLSGVKNKGKKKKKAVKKSYNFNKKTHHQSSESGCPEFHIAEVGLA